MSCIHSVYCGMPDPPASSFPDQLTRKFGETLKPRSGSTLLVGGPSSTVLKIGGVSSGFSVSNTIVARASIRVPVELVLRGRTV